MVNLADAVSSVRRLPGKTDVARCIPGTSGIRPALTSLARVSVLLLALATSAAEAIRDGILNATFQCPTSPHNDEYSDGIVSRNVAGQLEINHQWHGGFDALGTITTSGGERPRASLNMQTVGSGEQGVWLFVRATASVIYYFRLVPAPGTVWYAAVPVHVTAGGQMSTAANPSTNIGHAKLQVTILHGTVWSTGVDLTGRTGDESFSVDTTLNTPHSADCYVSILAVGELNVFTGQTTTISGWVDPVLEIDPTWARNHPDVHFTIEYSPGFGPVVPEPTTLTVTAADKARFYGDPNPALTLTYSGFVNGDDEGDLDAAPTAACAANAASAAGVYPIVPSGGADSNYSFAYVNGTLSVDPAALIVTADNAIRQIGQPNPAFSCTPAGLRNGDTLTSIGLTPTYTCAADAGSATGPYPITPSGPATTANYTVTYLPGTLTVVPVSHTVNFVAVANGTISGSTPQTVLSGGDTAPVTAVAAYGYVFRQWSDGSTENPLTVQDVTADLTLTASFRTGDPVAPAGHFTAVVDAAAAPGHRLWDLTSAYTTSVAGNPLVLDLLHDATGRLSGTATYTIAKDTVVTMPIRGSVKGSFGSITMKGSLKGTNPAELVSVSLTLNLTVDPASRQLVGHMAGNISNSGTTTPVDDPVVLDIPGTMDGTWTLRFDLDQSGRNVTGTAILTLSNDVQHTFAIRGRTGANGTAVLTLSGAPRDPASKAISIKTALTPLEGGWARIESFSARGYGQAVGW